MSISFTKMNSQGNDFIVIDIAQETFLENQDNIKKICSRDDVGCDQLLLINTSNPGEVACTIYNSDGTSACQCGNGLRAIMLYLHKKFSITESTIKVCTKDYNAKIIDRNKISVDLGKPVFFTEQVDGLKQYKGEVVDVGNKHFVIWGYDKDDSYVVSPIYSEDLDYHSEELNELQSKYNLTFILDGDLKGEKSFPVLKENNFMRIKVKERGAGWTKSCGSGAIAAAALALDKYYQTESYYGLTPEEIEESYYDIQSPIFVEQEGGVLEVHHDDRDSLKLVGPSEFEYDGVWSA